MKLDLIPHPREPAAALTFMQVVRSKPVKLQFYASQYMSTTFLLVGLLICPFIVYKVEKATGLDEKNRQGKKLLKEYRKRPGGTKQIHADYHYMKHELEKQWESAAHGKA